GSMKRSANTTDCGGCRTWERAKWNARNVGIKTSKMPFSDVNTLVSSRSVSSGSMAVSRCSTRLRLKRNTRADKAMTDTAEEKNGTSGKRSCQWRKGANPM